MKEGSKETFQMEEPPIWISIAVVIGMALMGLGFIYACKLVAMALGWA